MPESQGLGPTIPLRRLGSELRRLREGQGKLLQDVARELLISSSKLSRIEKGQGAPRERDVRDLLGYYGQTDTELGARMRRWAAEGRETPWWQDGYDVPPLLDRYLQYETAATEISGYAIDFVPSLLQTADYARALQSALYPDDETDPDALVALTLRRQEALTRTDYPLSLDLVLDEAVLHRVVGSPAVMRAQLLALADAAELPTIRLRALPFAAGPDPAIAEGVFTIFHFRRDIDADVVNLESRLTDTYVEGEENVALYHRLTAGLRARALPPEATAEFVHDLASRFGNAPPERRP
jgi:transcriptional regulator with XRE-family HTH domain